MRPRQLLERECELETLSECLDNIETRGEVVVVDGPAGIGKTSLLAWTAEQAAERGYTVLTSRGVELESSFSFGVARQAFAPAIRRADRQLRRSLFTGAAGLVETMYIGAERPDQLERPQGSYAALLGSYSLLANWSDRSPFVLIVDDAHWADEASLRLLHFLSGRVADLHVMLLLATRSGSGAPGDLLQTAADRAGARRLRPAGLSQLATAELIRARDPSACDEFCCACHDATAGNPFFLVSALDELEAQGIKPSAQSVTAVRKLAPDGISRLVLPRLARLTSAARAFARAAAVLGDGSELRHAALLAELQKEQARAAADELTAAEILTGTEPLEFVHPIVRSVIYADLEPHARNHEHAKAAKVLAFDAAPHERVAAHLLIAGPVGDDWAIDHLRQAASEATRSGAKESAVAYLRRVLREPLQDVERARVLVQLASVAADPSPAHEGYLLKALSLTASLAPEMREARADATRMMCYRLGFLGRNEEAFELVDRAISELGTDDRELWLGLEAALASVVGLDPRLNLALGERLNRLESGLSGATPAERELLAMLAYQKLQGLEPASMAVDLAQRALAGGHLLAEGLRSGPFVAAMVLQFGERWEQAEHLLGQIISEARKLGELGAFAFAYSRRSSTRIPRGLLEAAQADAETGLDVFRASEDNMVVYEVLAPLLRVLVERGELSRCERELAACGATAELPENRWSTNLLVDRAAVRLAARRPREALVDLREAARRESTPGQGIVVPWRHLAAWAHHQVGDRAQAVELATEDLEITTRWGAAAAHGKAMSTLGLVEGGKAGIRRLREGEQLLAGSGATLEHARCLINLGAAIRRANCAREARDHLRAGTELAARCGASALVAFGDAELAATGGRRRRDVTVDGAMALTPSERRIADLAATGLSNREIAQALFVTRKTVEMHLGNAYKKLHIHSRDQLGMALYPDRETEHDAGEGLGPSLVAADRTADPW